MLGSATWIAVAMAFRLRAGSSIAVIDRHLYLELNAFRPRVVLMLFANCPEMFKTDDRCCLVAIFYLVSIGDFCFITSSQWLALQTT
jgi:hypothetical protein